jgi:hypothetical protein
MLFFSEKDNKIRLGEEFRQFFQRHPFFNFQLNLSKHQFGFVLPTTSQMSSESRRYIRFSLSLQARRLQSDEKYIPISINQIGIGGCLIDWDERVNVGDSVRVELLLQNRNWLPLDCKILYRMPGAALGVKFQNITKFEQELIAKLISVNLAENGLPYENPFATPIEYNDNIDATKNSLEANQVLA